MAWNLVFLDTFLGNLPDASFSLGKWTTADLGFANTTSAEDGLQAANGGSNCRRVVSGMNSGAMVGTRAKFVLGGNGYISLLMIDCGANQMRLDYNGTSGGFRFFQPLGGSVDTTADGTVSTDAYADAEMAVWFSGSTCYWEVKIDGVVFPTLSGSSASGSTPTIGYVGCSGFGATIGSSVIAQYWAKGYSGSGGIWGPGDYLGRVVRGIKRPNSDGQYAAGAGGARWSPLSGSTYYEMLDETTADSGTTTILDTTVPTTPAAADRYSVELVDLAGDVQTIKAAQRCCLRKLTSGTSATMRLGYSTRGSTGDTGVIMNAATITVPTSWTYSTDPLQLDPRDASDWTPTKLDEIDLIGQLETLVP